MTATSAKSALSAYVDEIEATFKTSRAGEHSYRRALQDLLEALVADITTINEPKRVECGSPDIEVGKNARHGTIRVGYVEAKDLDVKLDKAHRSEQIKRYLQLPNLILTNYREFRWYVNGEIMLKTRLIAFDKKGALTVRHEELDATEHLLKRFLERAPEKIKDAKELAERMAGIAAVLRDVVLNTFEKSEPSEVVAGLYKALSDVLIPNLKYNEFADIFSQTISYGLFAARVNHKADTPFRRQDAAFDIPATNPFLRRLFSFIVGPDIDTEPFVGLVDDLAQLLADADLEAILRSFARDDHRNDPIIHFYETFLAAYDPELRQKRGVYYTPTAVVDFIVNAVDSILRSDFSCANGLADSSRVTAAPKDGKPPSHRVLILDPACGTGTFLYSIIRHIRGAFMKSNNAGKWPDYVRDNLLPRIFGFEVLMAPYAVAHLKLGMELNAQDLPKSERAKWQYRFDGHDRLGVYLTNSLEAAHKQSDLLLGSFISEEANAAAHVKQDLPIMVVLGNPPYSIRSCNMSDSAAAFVDPFRYIGKSKIKERGALKFETILQDDYVKFWGFAIERIVRTGSGVVAFISNNGFLRNRVLRGMRYHLHQTFDHVFVLDLHGNTKKGERAPDGSRDQNVFDIVQGVAITICVKLPNSSTQHTVHHAEKYGTRSDKYKFLRDNGLDDIEWIEHVPSEPYYFFAPGDAALEAEYRQFISLDELMPFNKAGIVSGRDGFATDFDAAPLLGRLERFLDASLSDADVRSEFGIKDGGGYILHKRRESALERLANARDLKHPIDLANDIKDLLYRPFDVRKIAYTEAVLTSPQFAISDQMVGRPNVGLAIARGAEIQKGWEHVFCTRLPIQHHAVSLKEVNYLFPLWRYDAEILNHHDTLSATSRQANISIVGRERFEAAVSGKLKPKPATADEFSAEDIFNYVYGVLNCSIYRKRYAPLLNTDFPRVPLPPSMEAFKQFAALGSRLVGLHLLETLPPVITNYPVPGSNIVEDGFPTYVAEAEIDPYADAVAPAGRVYINGSIGGGGQYFQGVSRDVWEYSIGGYQVCERWLRDRRGRRLSGNEIDTYEKIVVALNETILLHGNLEAVYRTVWPDRTAITQVLDDTAEDLDETEEIDETTV